MYTDDLHYYHFLMLLDVNHIIIKDEKQNVILETRFNSTAKDYRTAREMGCSHSLYTD